MVYFPEWQQSNKFLLVDAIYLYKISLPFDYLSINDQSIFIYI